MDADQPLSVVQGILLKELGRHGQLMDEKAPGVCGIHPEMLKARGQASVP